MVKRLRVAILADYLEEEWPSMDLVADMLYEHLRREHAPTVEPTLVRPPMPRRLTRLPLVAAPAKATAVVALAVTRRGTTIRREVAITLAVGAVAEERFRPALRVNSSSRVVAALLMP